ncbi:UPF0182 family protein [Geomonas sp. Red32]|uniref:UPF0182 family membrane protein n=1 Tax=Geomonas sp. Red32 TaxID=2912856 RepID=UPI00202CAE07|nr:UPF0182 family protein [Geomonas sp. Red32]MCM0081619.1 UPF0182 family protein [Geomonas sp. Red32]
MLKNKPFILLLLILFVLVPSFSLLVNFYTDWLFFTETGFLSILKTNIAAQAASGLSCGLFFLFFLLTNLHFAFHATANVTRIHRQGGNVYQLRADQAAHLIKPVSILICFLLALMAGNWGAAQWREALLFLNGITVGTPDPVLGQDVGFYLFSLPLLEAIHGMLGGLFPLAALLVAAMYYLRGGISITPQGAVLDPKLRKHLAVLAFLYGLNLGFGFFLDGFELLLGGTGSFHGAGYTDVNARLVTFRALTVLAPIAGAVFAAGLWKNNWRLTVAPPVVIFGAYLLGVALYPSLLQKFKVAPNELDLETPYIKNSIKFTRMGYDLEKIQTIPFDVDLKLSAADITANQATIKNIRLWDTEPLLKTYSQLQQIRTYYRFFDVDNDRYLVNGRYTQVMLSPRELSYNDLPSRNWINERLIFTHGNGLTMGPVSRISKEGLPEFFLKDIPPVSLADIKVTRPEIYYGELSNDYVVVRTKVPEFSYPTATGNINTTYSGKGGVSIHSLARKALFAARFKSDKLLLSSDITPQSRILYYRNILERVRTLAPFLRFDNDPYLVVNGSGGLTWMIDAYTYSDRLPYSNPLKGGINYMRNSVKVSIDAYDGKVTFYLYDPSDVMAKVYSRIYPGLFKPASAMPEDLRRHVRYPHQFLLLQASVFASYHMTDPKVFYNKENLWEIPVMGDKQLEPYYTVMKLPGEKSEEYILLLPFTPSKRDNLAAWLTARCDGDNYGKIMAYTFPRDRLIYGPKQIDARINQDALISQQLTLWNQRGSEVIRGSMLVIPIEKSLLYVQPLYLVAEKGGLPELRRVIVAYGDDVVMEQTLELALQKIFGGKIAGEAPPASSAQAAPAAAGPPQSAQQLAREAMAIYERATNLQRQGDWAGYGEELRKLQQVLKRLAQ